MAGKMRKHPYSTFEKDLVISLVEMHPVISDRRTDGKVLEWKRAAWDKITDEYNQSTFVTQKGPVDYLLELRFPVPSGHSMAMYYYASKLNEPACSGCHRRTPPPPPSTTDTQLCPSNSAVKAGKHALMNGGVVGHAISQMHNESQLPAHSASQSTAMELNAGSLVISDVEFREGQVISGTLEALVDMLRPGADRSFIFTFLLCCRLYVKPHELLTMLCRRHMLQSPGEKQVIIDEQDCSTELAEMTSLIRLLGEWTRSFPYDFRDERMMSLVRTITQRCAAEDMSSVRDEVSTMLQQLLDKLTALEHYEETLNDPVQITSVDLLPQVDILTLGLTPAGLARQLTLAELWRLSFIGPEEFLQAFAPANPKPIPPNVSGASPSPEPKKTRNLECYADWFNRISYLVATDILKASKTKHRARTIEHWVMCGRECFNLGNFNSLMAIVSALNMSPIARLRKTWSRTMVVAQQQLRLLERCLEPSGNHARYRAALAAASGGVAPRVPLLSVTCRDLHFVNQATPNRVAGNRINFDKCRTLARHVSDQLMRRRQNEASGVTSERHQPTWQYLHNTPVLTETGLEMASFEREGPSDHAEKERYKSLKHSI